MATPSPVPEASAYTALSTEHLHASVFSTNASGPPVRGFTLAIGVVHGILLAMVLFRFVTVEADL